MSTCKERIFDGWHISSIDNRCSLSLVPIVGGSSIVVEPSPRSGSHCVAKRVRGSTESEPILPLRHPGNAELWSKGAMPIVCEVHNSFKDIPMSG
jgi:hypothetical protein